MSKDSPKDLKVRTASAIVMIAVAGSALWAGGWVFTTFVAIVAAGLLWEWWGLISKFNTRWWARALWMLGGVVYIGGATNSLIALNWLDGSTSTHWRFFFIGLVIFIDTGAYLFGRFIGGPKIAPDISPSKTWVGFFGGIIFCYIWMLVTFYLYLHGMYTSGFSSGGISRMLASGFALAVVMSAIAQLGDFFESWLKRKAMVKDSGALIPGHGGLFDRLDGLAALLFALTVSMATTGLHL